MIVKIATLEFMNKCFVIAEAGVNHNGSEDLALQLVKAAANAGADAVKFQTFRAESLVTKGTETAEYQEEMTGIKDQYEMIKKLELSEELHNKLFEYCRKIGIEFMSTPFDMKSAGFLINIGMEKIKIPSGEITNLPFIAELVKFNKPMILSTGMANLEEVKDAVTTVRKTREQQNYMQPLDEMLTILHCTSNYPARNEDVNLKAMLTMNKELGLSVGYSDHTAGTIASVAAVALGASVVEKHFTINRNLPGPDHQASLEPEELRKMVHEIRQVEACLGDGIKEPIESELPVRDLVRRSLVLVKNKLAGEIIDAEDIALLRPGTGIPPKHMEDVLGRTLKHAHKAGTVLTWKDLA